MSAAPGMNVLSVAEALIWYEQRLGFFCTFAVPGDDPPYAVVNRDNLVLHLRKCPSAAGTSFCYLTVDQAQQWSDELSEKGVTFRRHLEKSSYGMFDCEIIDCCGNIIGIGQPTA